MGSVCYHIAIMETQKTSARSRRSYRERIREVIQQRIVLGKPLTHREILKDAGGGSSSTVVSEMARIKLPSPAVLVGRGARTLPQRVLALEEALNAALSREKLLTVENDMLKRLLAEARSEVDKLLASHQDAQRLLLQGVDDLRQMVKAGQGGLPPGVVQAGAAKETGKESGESILWKTKHDQLLRRYIALEGRCREMASLLHDLGVDTDLTFS